MKLFVTGGTGQVGRRLVEDRRRRGDRVVVLTRDARRAAAALQGAEGVEIVEGDPSRPGPWQERVGGCDGVVNLAGAGIADRRWSASYKKVLHESRVQPARRVAEAIGAARVRPRVLVNASAVGFYGDRGDAKLDERASPGDDFLARMCQEWESAARGAADHGARVVLMRFGVVLDPAGGALKKMALPFRLGLGGPFASGRQYMPWIHWRDAVGLLDLALGSQGASGPMNAVAPGEVTNRQFTRDLGRALHRPAVVPAPRLGLRLIMGEVADALCASHRVVPAAAISLGYRFEHPELPGALADLLRAG